MPINDLPDGMSLPLDTVDNLSTLEEKLKDKKILKHMINYLGQIGGKNEGDSIRCILRTVFTNSLALKLNYAGRGQKIGIGKMLIRFVVIEAVKTNKCFSAKDSELEDLIKVWLRPACDRCEMVDEKLIFVGTKDQ